MRKLILTILSLHLAITVFSQSPISPIDSMRIEFQKDAEKMRSDFKEYEAQARAEYLQYAQSIKNIWGGDSIVDDTKYKWVEYSKDYRSRSIVDFDSGNVSVEIAIDETTKNNPDEIQRLLTKAIEQLLTSRGTSCPYNSSVDSVYPLTAQPVLENLLDLSAYEEPSNIASINTQKTSRPTPLQPTVKGKNLNVVSNEVPTSTMQSNKKTSGKTLAQKREEAKKKAAEKANNLNTQKNYSTIAQVIATQAPQVITSTTGADGKKREVVEVQMKLVSNSLSKNAALYKDLVAEFSQKFQVEEPLIFAVMEVESYFNPEATSHAPAYGLMQLVPTTGGVDAYRYVYKKEYTPTKSYLYNPRNNIELGTAYLRILMNSFRSVNDPHCRRLCVIASYNTGAGNVSRAFIGSTNLSKAFSHINQFDYNNLYNHLINNLPHQETRNYVKKVSEKREKYITK